MLNIKVAPKGSKTKEDVCFIMDSSQKTFPSDLKKYKDYVGKKQKDKKHQILRFIDSGSHMVVLLVYRDKDKSNSSHMESLRKLGASLLQKFNAEKASEAQISNLSEKFSAEEYSCLIEGMLLASYKFNKYKSKKENDSLKNVLIGGINIPSASEIKELITVCSANMTARDLINEPVITLNAPALGKEIQKISKKAGFTARILGMTEIKKLKMGGLLGVNLGSIDPPIFAIMEWKPAKVKNKKPYVLVGKGVVYDTGGNSLKTGNFMPTMKCDMSGAAAVIGTIMAVSNAKLPIHVIGLVPATDNRIGKNALVPDDVITMHDGSTVEVLNTDAEGRLILADALSYAKQYKPELVIDLATLTGAAAAITGSFGSAFMGTADEETKSALKSKGDEVYERLAELPFWDEYADLLKSEVADQKNIGGPVGGAITAGKFLLKYTDYPWIHIDIAGPAFIDRGEGYRHSGGTGVGVRLLYHFLKSRAGK